ncbi:hypothetical protein AM500_23310 [Bacillus sp. FJAT-18017]|uniref:hypothetical protein n=1 Tax=Bacillus sp. FJAT-18017 TaxID=1705566 RepID=UPI0006AE1F2A|nr:hypothetical protein [Bacillus sp. FJAT-18017]ALC92369.1 hypothetical protein AM500_23310 [Bacillus sp. FJAT-18017]
MNELKSKKQTCSPAKTRLPDLHPSKSTIEADIAKRSAGYKGECETDYYTDQLDHNKYFTLHDIRPKSNRVQILFRLSDGLPDNRISIRSVMFMWFQL